MGLAFDRAFEHILACEGGFVNHRLDNGGPTNYGITLNTLRAYVSEHATVEDLKNLPVATAKALYKEFYWDTCKLDLFPSGLSLAVFDQAVNRSCFSSVRTLQGVLKVTQDGIAGPETLTALRARREDDVIWEFLRQSMLAYTRIVQATPSQAIFLGGWMNRIFTLIDTLLVSQAARYSV